MSSAKMEDEKMRSIFEIGTRNCAIDDIAETEETICTPI